MKKLLICLSIGISLFAQQPDYVDMANKMYQKMQETVLPKSKSTLPTLEKMRECLADADNESEATTCFGMMKSEPSDEEMKILEDYGMASEQMDDEDLKWDVKTKKETLKELDEGILQLKAIIKCFEDNNNFDGFTICSQKVGI